MTQPYLPTLRWIDSDGLTYLVLQDQMDIVMAALGDPKMSFVSTGIMLRELEGWHVGQCMRLLRVILRNVMDDEKVPQAYRERAVEWLTPFGLTEFERRLP